MKFKHFRQPDKMDCGVTCLKMVANFHGANYPVSHLREFVSISRMGTNILGIEKAASAIGLKTLLSTGTVEDLVKEHILPAILYWNPNHFVVLYDIKFKKGRENEPLFYVADPAFDKHVFTESEFRKKWIGANTDQGGIILFIETTLSFTETYASFATHTPSILKQFYNDYVLKYKRQFAYILLITILTSLLNLAFPVLTQRIVDFGIPNHDLPFISLILLFQITAFFSSSIFEYLKSKFTLVLTTRINITVLTEFLHKLTRLSIGYFDNKMASDITQRVADHSRIERFLTANVLSTLFSVFNLFLFAILILKYDPYIFLSFCIITVLSIAWTATFIEKRKSIEYRRFEAYATSTNSVYEVVNGMKELKLNNAQQSKIKDWQVDQQKIHDLNKASLLLEQKQGIGNVLINQIRSAVITFYCAYLVIHHQITLGEMLSISYILGQLSSPFTQFFDFLKGWNEALFSFERIHEVNLKKDEDEENMIGGARAVIVREFSKIKFDNLSFKYNEALVPYTLRAIDFEINRGETVAFVGNSGSGKTTLLKMLLKFYKPTEGNILIDEIPLTMIQADNWRSFCGAVLQDGYIFSTSIAKNIALDSDKEDLERIKQVCRLANIDTFVESLPQQYETVIGNAGTGLSGGQIQRLLIARALYKDPEIFLFDEATSALDTENEKIIVNNIAEYCKGKTLIVIAHRLSTVKNADKIFVFDNGQIVEIGNHEELITTGGYYYRLVSNQLELAK